MMKASSEQPDVQPASSDEASPKTTLPATVQPPCSVLLVSWYFPAGNAIAAILIGKMARFLHESGHRVRVITHEAQSADQSLAVEIDDRSITRTPYLDLDGRVNPANRSRIGRTGEEDATVDQGTLRENSARYRAIRKLETTHCKRVDGVTTIGHGLADALAERGLSKDKIEPNAVDLARFAAMTAPDSALVQRFGLEGCLVLGFIGSFYTYEGLSMINAMPALLEAPPHLGLLLIGGGQDEHLLRARKAKKPRWQSDLHRANSASRCSRPLQHDRSLCLSVHADVANGPSHTVKPP